MQNHHENLANRAALLRLAPTASLFAVEPKPVKVFILAGQSNMEGQAVADLDGKDYNDGKGTLKALLNDPAKAALVKHLRTTRASGRCARTCGSATSPRTGRCKAGPLTLGFTPLRRQAPLRARNCSSATSSATISRSQVLLIKTAWGGKSLYKDFRPPSSGGEVGPYYTKMLAEVRQALANLKTDFPAYDGQGYELAGFVWYHGWNDGVDPKNAVPEYEQNLVNLIKDVRKDLKAPNLPVVIGELTGPWVKAPGAWATLRKAQAAAARGRSSRATSSSSRRTTSSARPKTLPTPATGTTSSATRKPTSWSATPLARGCGNCSRKPPPRERRRPALREAASVVATAFPSSTSPATSSGKSSSIRSPVNTWATRPRCCSKMARQSSRVHDPVCNHATLR